MADVSSNGQRKPLPDVNLLTPNDYRRLRVKLDGRDPDELLGGGVTEDVIQTLILAFKLRGDAAFTWELAGDVAPAEVFDMTGGEPPPPIPPANGPGGKPKRTTGSSSKTKRSASAPAPSSASTTA
jgi:hypothetical protein